MTRRWMIIKSVILGIAFLLTLLGTFMSLEVKQDEAMTTLFEPSDIPVLYMRTEGGKLINPAYGYAADVGARNLFNGITPLYEDRSLNISFYNYGARITDISYQIRDVETDQLLEDTVVKNIVSQEDYVNATLNIKNLIDKEKEYFLTITINTDKQKNIRYYERIIWTDQLQTDEKLDFVLAFNGYTYNKDQISNISKWIETNETGDNTNFGRVSIYSTRAQIGWGNLLARIEGNVVPIIWEITPTTAQCSLNYKVVTSSSSEEYEAYFVKDYYRIRQSSDEIYLMDYEREADQIFDAYNDLQSSGRINLGIKSELKDIEAKADKTGKYSFFVQNGNLWCYGRSENKFTNVFSFSSNGDYRGREIENEHEIKIIDVDSECNAWCSVCGYMNGGKHDGEMGLSLFRYFYGENIVKEYVYIPVNVPYSIMRGNVGDVSYINGDIYYVKINQYLYSIDLISGEYMLIADQLYDETYAVNASGSKIAYHDSHTRDSNKVIRIYDFETGSEKVITGLSYGSGKNTDYLKIIGYINDDLIYGMAAPGDFAEGEQLNSIFPMYSIVILSDEYVVMKRYEDPGKFVYAAEIDGMRVNLWRVTKNEEGKFETTSIDQLLNKEENSGSKSIYTEVVTTSLREKELYLNIPTSSGDLKNVNIRYAKEIQFVEKEPLILDSDYQFQSIYTAYGYGEWIGKYTTLRKAISVAAGYYGFVVDENNSYAWKKTEGNVPVSLDTENDVLNPYDYEYNLSGVSMDNILYYVSIGKVVAAKMGEDKFVYIYDYDKNHIIYYDGELGKTVTLDRETASKKFIQWDNIFLVLR